MPHMEDAKIASGGHGQRSWSEPLELPGSAEQILNAAADLFATLGFSKTTMSDVAERACVSKGLPYVYFPSKRFLLEAVQLRAIDRWLRATKEHLKLDEEPAKVSLMKAFKYSVIHSASDPICRAIMAQDPKVLLPDSDRVKDEIRRLNDVGFRSLLDQAQKEGDIRTDIGLDELVLIWRVTHDTLIHVRTDVFSWAPRHDSLETMVDTAIEILFNGLIPRPPVRAQAKAAVSK
jgi:AcrR family transcriptional regulator